MPAVAPRDYRVIAAAPYLRYNSGVRSHGTWQFVGINVVVWLAMTAILVVVPDSLDHQLSLPIARVIGWALACSVWVVTVEAGWKRRFGTLARFLVQLLLWVSAALVAMWVSDSFRVD